MKYKNRFLLLLFTFLLLTPSIHSKEFKYSHILKKPPISKNRYRFKINGVSAQIPYGSSIPINRKNLKVTKLLLAIHSSNLNADMYLKNSIDLAQKMANLDSTMVVAPQFLITSLLKKSGKKYYKSMVAVDEGRFKKEKKLRKKAFKLEDRGAKKQLKNK